MPLKPRWHADLDRIRAAVASLPSPFLDRRAVEKLFGLRRRQANHLMRSLGGYRVGRSALVGREELLKKLDELAQGSGGRGFLVQTTRKALVVEALDQIRAATRPRPIAPPPALRPGSALPEGARLTAPGELTIVFSSPEELLGRVLGLAQSASGDFAGFAAGVMEAPARKSAEAPEEP